MIRRALRSAFRDEDAAHRTLILFVAGAIVAAWALATAAAFWLLMGATAWSARFALEQLIALFGGR